MKSWLVKALLICLALFFTYTYFYQHIENDRAGSTAPVSQLNHTSHEMKPLNSANQTQTQLSDKMWKNDPQEAQGVLPRLTQAAGKLVSTIIQQGVVLLASLVNVFMHLFL